MNGKRDFDAAAATWDENPGRVQMTRAVAQTIVREVPLQGGLRLMDYGCGTGLVTLALQPYVRAVVAADSSEGMLQALTGKLAKAEITNVEPVKLDLEQQEWPGAPFDVIVSNMVLHHIQNVELVVRRMAEALVEGGWLAFADLDGGSEDFHADNTGIMYFGFDTHQRQALCQQAWLKEIRTVEALRIPRDGKEFPVLLTVGRK